MPLASEDTMKIRELAHGIRDAVNASTAVLAEIRDLQASANALFAEIRDHLRAGRPDRPYIDRGPSR